MTTVKILVIFFEKKVYALVQGFEKLGVSGTGELVRNLNNE